MNLLPAFLRRRSEQRAGYTDSVVAALLEQAASTSNVQRTAAVEIAAGIWGRSLCARYRRRPPGAGTSIQLGRERR